MVAALETLHILYMFSAQRLFMLIMTQCVRLPSEAMFGRVVHQTHSGGEVIESITH